MTEIVGEVVGTMLLILLGNGVVGGVALKGTKSENAGWIVVTFGWGLAVALGIYAVGKISGAHLNPAVTLGFASIGEFPWDKVPSYIFAQMAGALIGATLVWIQYLPHWKDSDPESQLAVFSTAPAKRIMWPNLISEFIGTFVLVLGILFIGANEFTEGLNPLIVGFLVLAIGLSLGGTTGYAINPARDLGPRIAHALLPITGKGGSDWAYSWIPVVGPILGGVYGALFYNSIFQSHGNKLFWIMSAGLAAMIFMAIWTQKKEDNKFFKKITR